MAHLDRREINRALAKTLTNSAAKIGMLPPRLPNCYGCSNAATFLGPERNATCIAL
jgi:hypothetical protein